MAELPDYPDTFAGRGVVIPGVGIRYFTCARVCTDMLRRLGCTLTVELWRLGPAEMPTPCARSGRSDRVSMVFDNAIRNTWLRATVPANSRTGLSAPDVFYVANLAGDTGGRGAPA